MKKIVVDTDVLIGHVIEADAGAGSDLRQLMNRFFCYTTVFSAIEAFSLCRGKAEHDAVEKTMNAMKILGLNAKSGKNIGQLFSSSSKKRDLHLLTAGVCLESRLPLVTGRKAMYRGISGLQMADPSDALAGKIQHRKN